MHFIGTERLPGRFPSCPLSAFPRISSQLNGQLQNVNISIRLSSWEFVTGAINVSSVLLHLSTGIYNISLDWNENVVPRLLAIFRSVEREIEGQKQRRNIETRQQEFAECSARFIEQHKPFLDSTVLRRVPQVQKPPSDGDYKAPATAEKFSSIHDELVVWADRELALTYSAMANSFRSVHQELLSQNTSTISDHEFLEKVVTMFGCKSCKAVYDYTAYAKHEKECAKAIRARSLGSRGSGPAERHAVVLALHLLQLLGLPEDSTRALVEQTFHGTKFVCLCGNPKFRKQVGFFELVRPIPTSVRLVSQANCSFLLKLQHLISENEAYEEVKHQIQMGGGRAGSAKGVLGDDLPWINDHDPSLLPSLIRRVDPGQPRWVFETRYANGRGSTKPHQAHCDLCFRLTGVRKFLGGDKEYIAYHMEAK